MKSKTPEIRILRKSVYVDPGFWYNGYSSKKDYLQYKDGNEWKNIPVEYDEHYIEVGKNEDKTLGNQW